MHYCCVCVGIRAFDLNVSICSKSVPHARCRTKEKKLGKTCFYVITALMVQFQQLLGRGGNYIEFQQYHTKNYLIIINKITVTLRPKTMIAGDKYKIKLHITIQPLHERQAEAIAMRHVNTGTAHKHNIILLYLLFTTKSERVLNRWVFSIHDAVSDIKNKLYYVEKD